MNNTNNRVYENGIFFMCQQCGNCCKISDGWVELSEKEISHATDLKKMSKQEFMEDFVDKIDDGKYILKNRDDGACIFLSKNNHCEIYEARPGHCRYFPFRPENMKTIRRWEATKDFCKGIDNGKYYSKDDIKILLKEQRTKS